MKIQGEREIKGGASGFESITLRRAIIAMFLIVAIFRTMFHIRKEFEAVAGQNFDPQFDTGTHFFINYCCIS